MLYLVTGKLRDREILGRNREEFLTFLEKVFSPTLDILLENQKKGIVEGGGLIASKPHLVFIIRLDGCRSHLDVRKFLFQLAAHPYCDWEVTPLESFAEQLETYRGESASPI